MQATIEKIKTYCKEDGIPRPKSLIAALKKLESQDMFLLWDALGCSERTELEDHLYNLAFELWRSCASK